MYEKIVESSRFCAMGYNGACDGCIFCGKSNDKDGECYQQLHKAAADAIEELSKSKWIPITERLPEESWERVLTYTDDGTVMTLPAIKLRNGYVRYWMPLPEPPKEGE